MGEPFRIKCRECGEREGYGKAGWSDAELAGWTEIEEDPDLSWIAYLGICPACGEAQEES